MRFSDIYGNEALKASLASMVDSGRLGHAILLVEEEGMGALPIAIALAQYLDCSDKKDGDSCGQCAGCHKISKQIHPDVNFVFPVNSSNLLSESDKKRPSSDMFMDQWRSIIVSNPYFSEQDWYQAIGIENKSGNISVTEAKRVTEILSLKPYESENRIIIIYLAEKLNTEASNKLLKLLEEPPEKSFFILISKQPYKLLPTVLSRCRILNLQPSEIEPLAEELVKVKDIAREDALVYARLSHGCYGKALKLCEEQPDDDESEELLEGLLDAAIAKNLVEVIATAERIADLQKEKQKDFCIRAEAYIRKLFMFAIKAEEISFAKKEELDKIQQYAAKIKQDFYRKALSLFDAAIHELESNVGAKLVFVDLCCRIYNCI